MRCINCGYENDENAHFCIKCGSGLAYNWSPLEGIMTQLVKDSLFMVMCILYSTGIVFSLIVRDFPLIRILMAIFLWLFYAQCTKGSVDSKYMRYISGTLFASYVLRWVAGGLVVLCGFFLIGLAAVIETSSQWRQIYSIIMPYLDRYSSIEGVDTEMFLVVIAFVLILGGIIATIISVTGMRSIHRFAQSLYRSLDDGRQWNVVGCGSARLWLMVFGVFAALSALRSGEVFSLFGGGCQAAALILGSVLVKKYFHNFE